MFIMTDGEPNRGGDPCSLKPQLDALDIQVILIGVGSFDRTLVECLGMDIYIIADILDKCIL